MEWIIDQRALADQIEYRFDLGSWSGGDCEWQDGTKGQEASAGRIP